MSHQHFRVLTDKLAESAAIASDTQKGQRLIKLLQANIKKILNPAIALEEQRARDKAIGMQQQKVIDNTPIIIVPLMPRITNAPPILQAWNPTAKRTLKDTLRLHQQVTEQHSGRRTEDNQTTYTCPHTARARKEAHKNHTNS